MLTARLLAGAVLFAFTGLGASEPPRIDRHASDLHRVASAPTHAGDPKAIKVIGMWLRLYRSGRWDLTGSDRRRRMMRGGRGAPSYNYEKDSLIAKYDLIPKDYLGQVTYLSEIDILCKHAQELDTADAAKAVLEVAAVGLDNKVKYVGTMSPTSVRGVGEGHLRRFSSGVVLEYLAKAAAGNPGGNSKFKNSMQAAALRALGVKKSSEHRKIMIDQLGASDKQVRSAAALALGRLGEAYSVKPLAERLAREGDAATIIEILSAIDMIRAPKSERSVKIEHMQMAVIEAGKALGRTDSWRPDLAIVEFLAKYRYKDSIPLLIALLERFLSEPHNVKSNRLSERLRTRAQEVLVELTGTRIPATAPAKWREFWNRNEATFKLAKPQDGKGRQDEERTAGGFFNIPVLGKRVVFVIDVSNSMNWPMQVRGSGRTVAGGKGSGRGSIKITIAKAELWKAVSGLPSDAKFNVVFYNHEVDQWSKKLVPANPSNKKRFKTWLDAQRASGNTNIYDAMKLALKLKSLVYGQHYDSSVDEVFLLSDGMPNTGEVTDPNQIVKIITETNKFSRVRINTVYLEDSAGGGRGGRGGFRGGFGAGSGAGLMKRLAEKNDGKFVKL